MIAAIELKLTGERSDVHLDEHWSATQYPGFYAQAPASDPDLRGLEGALEASGMCGDEDEDDIHTTHYLTGTMADLKRALAGAGLEWTPPDAPAGWEDARVTVTIFR